MMPHEYYAEQIVVFNNPSAIFTDSLAIFSSANFALILLHVTYLSAYTFIFAKFDIIKYNM